MNETEQSDNSNKILYVDVGNTLIKLKKYNGNSWDNIYQVTHNDLKILADYFGEHASRYERVIVSSVVDDVSKKLYTIFNPLPVIFLETNTIPQNQLNYNTPGTLGIDRFLSCYGAWKKTKGQVVVIDAGTACTVDFMDNDGVFQGGVIMPGLKILEDGLTRYAPALPGVDRKIPEIWPGKSTEASLQWGITGFFKDALDTMLFRYEKQYGHFTLWLTGGDAVFLQQYLQNDVKLDSDLVFEGMRYFTLNRNKD